MTCTCVYKVGCKSQDTKQENDLLQETKNSFGIAMKSDSEIARGEERSEISRRKFLTE